MRSLTNFIFGRENRFRFIFISTILITFVLLVKVFNQTTPDLINERREDNSRQEHGSLSTLLSSHLMRGPILLPGSANKYVTQLSLRVVNLTLPKPSYATKTVLWRGLNYDRKRPTIKTRIRRLHARKMGDGRIQHNSLT